MESVVGSGVEQDNELVKIFIPLFVCLYQYPPILEIESKQKCFQSIMNTVTWPKIIQNFFPWWLGPNLKSENYLK